MKKTPDDSANQSKILENLVPNNKLLFNKSIIMKSHEDSRNSVIEKNLNELTIKTEDQNQKNQPEDTEHHINFQKKYGDKKLSEILKKMNKKV